MYPRNWKVSLVSLVVFVALVLFAYQLSKPVVSNADTATPEVSITTVAIE